MAFPTTSVFADGSTTAGFTNSAYTNGPVATTAGLFAGTIASGFSSMQWNALTVTETEIYCTLNTFGGSGEAVNMHMRDNANDGTADFYYLQVALDGSGDLPWGIFRALDNGDTENVLLTSGTISAPAAGCKVGATCQGVGATVTITAWYQALAGSWVSQGSIDDTNVNRRTNAGKLGVDIFDTVWRIDDIGGGEIVTTTVLPSDTPFVIGGRGASW